MRTLQKQHHIESNVQEEHQHLDLQTINMILDNQLDSKKGFAKLSEEDLVISSVTGIFAAIIDGIFVDLPFQAEFDESLLQKLLENIWHSSLKDFVLYLEEKVKVLYDTSIHKSGLRSDNHRLKSFLMIHFWVSFFDFVFATTTYIDKHGNLNIL